MEKVQYQELLKVKSDEIAKLKRENEFLVKTVKKLNVTLGRIIERYIA